MKKDVGITSDLLRVLATLFVFFLHGREFVPKANELPLPFNWITCFPAWAGVWIFFVLSGYAIGCGFFTGRYQLFSENGKFKVSNLVKFYLGRFIKIAPLYYLYCILFEILSNNLFFWNDSQVLIKILTFTFNGNNGRIGFGHLWYISTAMQLYLFMPFFYLVLDLLKDKKNVLLIVYIISIIGGISFRSILFNNGFDWYTHIYTNCFSNLDLILTGMIVAEIKCIYDVSASKLQILLKIIASFSFVLLVLYNCYIYSYGSADQYIYRCILPSAYAVSCGILILLSGNKIKKSEGNLFKTIINWFAKYSYTFYIFHIAVFVYLNQTLVLADWFVEAGAFAQYIVFFIVSFCIIICLAVPFNWIGQIFVEKYLSLEKRVFK